MRIDPLHHARQQYTNAQARADINTPPSDILSGRKMVGSLLIYVLTILTFLILFKLAVS